MGVWACPPNSSELLTGFAIQYNRTQFIAIYVVFLGKDKDRKLLAEGVQNQNLEKMTLDLQQKYVNL